MLALSCQYERREIMIKHDDCIFCKIVDGVIPSSIVYEDDADSAKEKPQKGEVVAVGEGKLNDKNERQPMDVKVGDKILYAKYAGTDVKVDGAEYKILSINDALAIIE